ncbi:MAG: ABC transporter permease [Rickettsiales bacterium]|nr:ABC transporter permease [Rickettsiales bacterium]
MAKEQSIRVSTNEKPTMFNRGANLGFAIMGGPLALIMGPVAITMAAAGALVGGLWQKSNMKADLQVGKRLDPPTFWNSSIITGMFLASQVALAGAVLFGAALPALAVAGSILAAPIVGALVGGFSRKSQMAKEYAAGKEQLAYESLKTGRAFGVEPELQMSTEKGRGQSQSVGNPYYNSVTSAETALMDARMKAGPDMEKLDYRQQMELAKLEQAVEQEQGAASGGR